MTKKNKNGQRGVGGLMLMIMGLVFAGVVTAMIIFVVLVFLHLAGIF